MSLNLDKTALQIQDMVSELKGRDLEHQKHLQACLDGMARTPAEYQRLLDKVSDYGLAGLGALAATHWLVDLAWLCLISFIVYRTHRLWGSRVRELVFIGCGLLLVVFGVYFIISGLKLWLA